MLSLVLWSLLVLITAGGIVFLIVRTRQRAKPQIPIRKAIAAAKEALKNKEEWPKLYYCSPDKLESELIAYNTVKSEDLNQPGVYRMRWPHLDLQYTIQKNSEEVRLKLDGQDKPVTLLYLQGLLGSMTLGDDRYDAEDFEMRHAVNLADRFRKDLRKQLCGGYGTQRHKKLVEKDPPSDYQVNAAGEIKLSEIPAKKG